MAKKLTFSHPCNSRNDEKIAALRMKFGAEGYGVFYMIVEKLYQCDLFASPPDYEVFAFDIRVSVETIKSVIHDFDLFQFSDGLFYYDNKLINVQDKEDRDVKSAPASPEDDAILQKFNGWLKKNAPSILRMSEPISASDLKKLRDAYSSDYIANKFIQMDNWKPLLAKNKSAYRTFINWSTREANK